MFSLSKGWLATVLGATLLVAILLLSSCTGAPAQGWAGVLVDGDFLYVVATGGKLLLFDVRTGNPGAEEDVAEAKQAGGFLACSPPAPVAIYGPPALASDGVIYFGTYDGRVYAAQTGTLTKPDGTTTITVEKVSWVYETGGAIVGDVVVDEETNTLFVGSSDGKLHAIDRSSSNTSKWVFPTEDKIWSSPVVADGVVYFGSLDHKLYALDAATGQPLWEPFEAKGAIASTPLVIDGVVYLGSFGGKFQAVDTRSGEQKWVFEGPEGWIWAKAAYDETADTLYVGSFDHKLYAFARSDGKPVPGWTPPDLGAPIKAAPVLVGDMLVVGSATGSIVGLNPARWAAEQKVEWQFDAGADLRSDITVADGNVYFVTIDGVVHARSGEDGRSLWEQPTVKTR